MKSDGTGSISPALRPLADRLIASPNRKSTWMWLRRPYVRRRLELLRRAQRREIRHLRLAGFLTGIARPAALRQLVLQAPAPVITRALGFHDTTTTRVAADAGGTWNRYAPNDHS
jgi:hypothetical protein